MSTTDKKAYPDGYWFHNGKLNVEALAGTIMDGLAIGPDGQIWAYANGVHAPAPDEIAYRTAAEMTREWHSRHADQVEAYLRARRVLSVLPEIPPLDAINLTNGLYYWQDDELFPHRENFPGTAQLSFAYDAEATCPRFTKWLAKAVPPDALETTWEAIGYALMFGNPLQKAILLHGSRGTGKSTLLKTLEHMIGKQNVSHVSLRDITTSRFRVAAMGGKVANVMGDIDAKYLEDPSMFKAITGEDPIQVEQKYGKPYDIHVWATPIFSANSFWRSGDVTDAYLERFVVLSFPYDQRNSDTDFSYQALFDEAPGIFNEAMKALRRLMARGKFEIAGSLGEVNNAFAVEADIVRRWLAEDDNVTFHEAGSELVQTKRSELYAAFKSWLTSNGHKTMGSDVLYKRLEALGYVQKKNSDRYFQGIQVKAVLHDWDSMTRF